MNEMPYSFEEVLTIDGIPYTNKSNIRVKCPFCGGKRKDKNLGINLNNGTFHCFSCGISGRGATVFHSLLYNITTKEAYHDICNRLNISDASNRMTVERRYIEKTVYEPETIIEEADEDTLDKFYTLLLENLSLSDKHKNDLLCRGFTEEEIARIGYKSYIPYSSTGISPELFDIPKKILLKVNRKEEFLGIPGFYRTKNKHVWRLPNLRNCILVPYRNFNNKIVGLQYRVDDELLEEGEHKYGWLSSADKLDGCSIKTKVHFACDFLWDREKSLFYPNMELGTVLITEGAMKGECAHCMSGYPLLAIPGLTSARSALTEALKQLKKIGLAKVILAVDMDKVLNLNVAKALIELKQLIEEIGLECDELSWNNTFVHFSGEQEKFDMEEDFVFNPATLLKALTAEEKRKQLPFFLEECKKIGKKRILFAFGNSTQITEDNKGYSGILQKECEKVGLSYEPVFWALKTKGIDDFYANITSKK